MASPTEDPSSKNLPVPVALGDRATKRSHAPSCQLCKKGNHLQLGGNPDWQERWQPKMLQVASLRRSQLYCYSELPAICSPYDTVHFHISDKHSFHIIIKREGISFRQDLHVTGGDRQLSEEDSPMHSSPLCSETCPYSSLIFCVVLWKTV